MLNSWKTPPATVYVVTEHSRLLDDFICRTGYFTTHDITEERWGRWYIYIQLLRSFCIIDISDHSSWVGWEPLVFNKQWKWTLKVTVWPYQRNSTTWPEFWFEAPLQPTMIANHHECGKSILLATASWNSSIKNQVKHSAYVMYRFLCQHIMHMQQPLW